MKNFLFSFNKLINIACIVIIYNVHIVSGTDAAAINVSSVNCSSNDINIFNTNHVEYNIVHHDEGPTKVFERSLNADLLRLSDLSFS